MFTWNVSIAFNGSVHDVSASRKNVCPGIRTSSNPVPGNLGGADIRFNQNMLIVLNFGQISVELIDS